MSDAAANHFCCSIFFSLCSFDNQRGKYKVSLEKNSIQDAWNSAVFESFRRGFTPCKNCREYKTCNGGCGLELGINAGAGCN